jgi:hypothetical protein
MVPISDKEMERWTRAVEPVIADYKKDMVSKGYKAADIDGWVTFMRERIEYWKGQERARKIAAAHQD